MQRMAMLALCFASSTTATMHTSTATAMLRSGCRCWGVLDALAAVLMLGCLKHGHLVFANTEKLSCGSINSRVMLLSIMPSAVHCDVVALRVALL